MRKILLFLICLNLLGPAMILTVNPASAADEDLTSSVYLVFDPDTGDFVTVDDRNRVIQDHENLEQVPAAQGLSPPGETSGRPELPLSVSIAIGAFLASVLVWAQMKKHRSPDP